MFKHKVIKMIGLACFLGVIFSQSALAEKIVAPAPNGIHIPKDYKNWQMIAVSHRTDNHTLRVILGNPIAVKAAKNGNTKPWPDGAILAKIVWKDTDHPLWPAATVPGALVHAEFMMKDSKKFAMTEGWGFSRWSGMEQKPYGKDAAFAFECLNCHQPAKANDYVFTRSAQVP